MARAILFSIENADKMKNQVYNVGSEKMNCTKEEICKLIQKQIKCYVHYAEISSDEDKRNYSISYEKIEKMGYKPTISIENGIKELKEGLEVISLSSAYSNS
jgi:nucleoside-diphosphate-sugar epimerase